MCLSVKPYHKVLGASWCCIGFNNRWYINGIFSAGNNSEMTSQIDEGSTVIALMYLHNFKIVKKFYCRAM